MPAKLRLLAVKNGKESRILTKMKTFWSWQREEERHIERREREGIRRRER